MSKITNQEDESAEKAFYREMDQKKFHRSCCTWQTFLIFFVCLAILAGGVTIYFFYKIKQSGFTINRLYPSNVSKQNFQDKLKISKENPTFSVTVTSAELTSLAGDGIKTLTFEIKDIQIEINSQSLIIYGKLTKPLKSDIKIETAPKVFEGKIYFKVEKISAGKLILPSFLNNEVEKALNNLMAENFATLYENCQVEKVELENDQMIISGKLKENR